MMEYQDTDGASRNDFRSAPFLIQSAKGRLYGKRSPTVYMRILGKERVTSCNMRLNCFLMKKFGNVYRYKNHFRFSDYDKLHVSDAKGNTGLSV